MTNEKNWINNCMVDKYLMIFFLKMIHLKKKCLQIVNFFHKIKQNNYNPSLSLYNFF